MSLSTFILLTVLSVVIESSFDIIVLSCVNVVLSVAEIQVKHINIERTNSIGNIFLNNFLSKINYTFLIKY